MVLMLSIHLILIGVRRLLLLIMVSINLWDFLIMGIIQLQLKIVKIKFIQIKLWEVVVQSLLQTELTTHTVM